MNVNGGKKALKGRGQHKAIPWRLFKNSKSGKHMKTPRIDILYIIIYIHTYIQNAFLTFQVTPNFEACLKPWRLWCESYFLPIEQHFMIRIRVQYTPLQVDDMESINPGKSESHWKNPFWASMFQRCNSNDACSDASSAHCASDVRHAWYWPGRWPDRTKIDLIAFTWDLG